MHQYLNYSLHLILITTLIGLPIQQASAATPYTDALMKDHGIQSSVEDCAKVEKHLGQLFYVNVDGFGSSRVPGDDAISPGYVQMVKDLQIGGVLPHFGTSTIKKMNSAAVNLQKASDHPLMMGVDYLSISHPPSTSSHVGLGFHGGFMSDYGEATMSCKKELASLSAFAQKAAGINQALGPTIENTKQWKNMDSPPEVVAKSAKIVIDAYNHYGMATTMKHFPYTPDDYNLHNKSEDTKMSADEVTRKLKNFKLVSDKTDFAMSTHLYNSNVDPDDMATFSKKWVSKLRKEVGFKGILMTDALFMFDNYPDTVKQMTERWDQQEKTKVKDIHSIFAARAILAGHDMVFLEGNAESTYKVFKDLHKLACQNNSIGQELRKRVEESYKRIVAYKQKSKSFLRDQPDVPKELLDETLAMLGTGRDTPCPDPKRWDKWFKEVASLNLKSRGTQPGFDAEEAQACGPNAANPGEAAPIQNITNGIVEKLKGSQKKELK